MHQNNIKRLYSKKSSLYHNLIGFLKYKEGIEKFFNKNQNYIKPHFKILDAGCGSGIVTKILYNLAQKKMLRRITFHGFDLTKVMLYMLKQWIKRGKVQIISLRQADVLLLKKQLPEEWKDYDLIVSSAMLEYIPKEKMGIALMNLKERLKGKGVFLLFITKNNLFNKVFINKWWKANMYKKEEIEALLLGIGYKKITFREFPFPYSYLNHWGFIIEAKN